MSEKIDCNIELKNLNSFNKKDKENNQSLLFSNELLKKYNFKDSNTEVNKNINEDKDNSYLTLDLSSYKSFKILGLNIYSIGNTYAFGFFNFFSEPLFCIDNMWYLHFIIYLIEVIVYYLGNYILFYKIEKWKQTTFYILLITLFVSYTLLVLINQGIIIKTKKGYKHKGFCSKCNIYYIPEEDIYHCANCNICVKKYDHHCHIIRKCITKRNIILFFLMVGNFLLIYFFFLINFIIYIYYYFKK